MLNSEQIESAHLRSKTPKTTILILINHKSVSVGGVLIEEKIRLENNKIITSKYTLLNFLPKNLFLQFRRVGNFYFLMTSILQSFIDSPVSPATCLIPLSFVVIVTAIKQGYEDWLRHKADTLTNSRLLPVVVPGQTSDELDNTQSRNIRLGDIIQVRDEEEIPCDLVLLTSSANDGNCSIATANLDGETNLKKKLSVTLTKKLKTASELSKLSGVVECEEPNPDLYEFSGILTINEAKENLRADNLLLRGSRVVNTTYIFGLAVYTGKDTKMSLNSKTMHFKFSSLEKSINIYLFIYLILLFMLCSICNCFRYSIILNSNRVLSEHWYLENVFFKYRTLDGNAIVYNFLNFFVLFNYLIPISLYVSLEMTRFFGAKLMTMNKHFEGETKDDLLICNCSDINEELGQVKYLFSDKTGTLTENKMKFVSCSINGQRFTLRGSSLFSVQQVNHKEFKETKLSALTVEQKFFFVCLAICNTVSVKAIQRNPLKNTVLKAKIKARNPLSEFRYEYIADSPDEKALVEAAAYLNVTLTHSSESEFRVVINEREFSYKKLKIIEFDSVRKRMSVLVRDPLNRIYLICKGAESELIGLIKRGKVKDVYHDIDDFATSGLRTLTIAYRCLSDKELEQYMAMNKSALEDFANKKQKIDECNKFLECNLSLLGATGVEDKLQEDVENTLIALKKAGIYIWLLTGDKLETAISVAFSCKLVEPEFHILSLSRQKDIQSCRNCLIRFWVGIKKSTNMEKFSFQQNLLEIEAKMNVAVKMANFLFNRLENYEKHERQERSLSEKSKKTSVPDQTLIDRLHHECFNKLEFKIDELIKLEDALKTLKVHNFKKNQSANITRKAKLKKINRQLNKDIDELEKIETCLNTNDYNLLLHHSKPHSSIKKSSTSSNLGDTYSSSFLQPKNFKLPIEVDCKNFNLSEELKESNEVGRLLKEKFALIIDGGSLYIALRYHYKLFELVCQHCSVVICSRMSPIQKAQIVKMVRCLPTKPITAAIGDGANDVSMIQEAHVGFGIFGKEGIQAVRNSDFAFLKFKFVKTVLLVHGHYFYSRISHLVHFFFFKNMVFIMPQFFYSFYNLFSGQTIYHGMLLMLYNLLFTATPIFFYSIQDEIIPRFFLTEYPTLYKTLSGNALMQMNIVFKWITFSTAQGIAVFFSIRFLWSGTISMLSSGNEHGTFSFGLIVYHIVVLIVNSKLLIMSRNWQPSFLLSIIGSIVMLPVFCLIYSSFQWNFLDDGMYGQYNQIFKSFSFWVTILMITFLVILIDVIYSVLENSLNLRNYLKLIENKNKEKQAANET